MVNIIAYYVSGCLAAIAHSDHTYQTSLPTMKFPEGAMAPFSSSSRFRNYVGNPVEESSPSSSDSPLAIFSSPFPSVLSKQYLTSPGVYRTPAYNTKQFVGSSSDHHIHHYHHDERNKSPPRLDINNETSHTFLGQMAAIDCTLHHSQEHSVSP